MNDDHSHLWRQMILHVEEARLANRTVLDDGCDIIAAYSNVPVRDYTLDDYGQAFFEAGFAVSAKPYAFRGFVPLKRANIYFPRIAGSLQYHAVDKTLFRLVSAQAAPCSQRG